MSKFTYFYTTNYFTLLFCFFNLSIPPSVIYAQKLNVAASEKPSFILDPVRYFKELTTAPKTEVESTDASMICYTLTTPSPATQSVCTGVTGTNITVRTSTNIAGGIRFVRFSTDQMAGSTPTATESAFLYSYTGAYTDLAYVTPTGSTSPYTATYTFSTLDFPNATNNPITYYVYAVFNQGLVNSTCTINPAVEIQVTVKPKPQVATIADQYVCAGSTTSAVTLTGSTVASTTYAWTNNTTSIGLAASGSTTVPSFTATNATSSPVTATITATPTANGCTGQSQTFKIVAYPSSASRISGIAFNDFNENGIREGGEGVQEGIVVNVFNNSGTLVTSTTTDATGFWTATGLTFGSATDKYRVEFSIPTSLSSSGLQPALKGTNNRTDVQFVSAASCNVNFGVSYASNYLPSSNPILVTPCYTNGSRVDNSNEAAVVLYKYNERGQGVPHEVVATLGEVGSVWGEAYNPYNKKLYLSAVIKRHSDLPPHGVGAIYEIDLTTPTAAGAGTPTLWLDINSASFVDQSNVAVNLNLPTDPGIATRGLGIKTNPNRDNWAFDRVGKQGIGDIELSEDGQRLYVMDLTNRQVLCINYATKKLIWKLAVSTPACTGGSTNIRPWALKEYKGVLYVGAVCSGEVNKTSTDLHYYVMKCNSLTAATAMSLAVDMGSAINKTDGNVWNFWVTNPADIGMTTLPNGGYAVYPQPLISDIEFDKDDNMIIGLLDRTGHQTGRSNYIPNVTNTNLITGIGVGDMTRATKSGSSFTVETAPWSFFYLTAAIPNPPHDQFEGGLVVSSASGTNYAVAQMIDPLDYESSGTTWLRTSDGQQQGDLNETGRLEIVPQSTSVETFGKANGLGDLSLLSETPPIEIGNYVWLDADKDGVQDPAETPLSNITVSLWKGGTQIASTTTNSSGEYYFSSKYLLGAAWTGTGADTALLANTAYEIRIDTSNQTPLDTLKLTVANATTNSGNDQNDSDASVTGNYAVIALTTGVYGSTNHTFDFGFFTCHKPALLDTTLTFCGSQTLNLTHLVRDASSYTNSYSAQSYYRYYNDNWTTLTDSTAVTVTATDSFYVIKDPFVCNPDTMKVVVRINPVPTINDSSKAICLGATVDLTQLIANYATYTNPVWTIGSVSGTTVATPTAVAPSVNTTYFLVAANGSGCRDTASVAMTINALPDFTLVKPTTCPGSTEDVNITNLTNAIAATAQYKVDAGSFAAYPSPATISGLSAGNHTITIKNAAGCETAKSVTINALTPQICTPVTVMKSN